MNAAPQSRNTLHLELAAETLRKFGEIRFVARGTSMLPTLYPGDCLTITSFGSAAPDCGDVVLCRRAGEFRVHRIVGILRQASSTFYVLRGDSLTEDDPPVPACDVLGRVTALSHRGKSIELDSTGIERHRLLISIVRHSKMAVLFLLCWHTMRSLDFFEVESSSASSAKTRMQCT